MQPRLWTINWFQVFPKLRTFINFNVDFIKMDLHSFIVLWKTKEGLTYLQMYILISLRAELIFIIFPSLIIFDTPWVFSYCMVLWCTKGQNIFISAQSFLPTVFASGNIASRCWIRKKQLYGNPPYWMVIELDESLKTKKFLGPKEI